MERLTIDGGEVWLGFARSRVKVLQNAGLTHTRQQFNMPDGATVVVELAGKDHTIRLTNSAGSIISGVVKEGKLIELPVPAGSPAGAKPKKVLRSFKATKDAAKKVLKNLLAASGFRDSGLLTAPRGAYLQPPDPRQHGSQAGTIFSSQYSGEMRHVIQLLLGSKDRPEIKYGYQCYECHGIVRDDKSKPWLVMISTRYGVVAMPLPVKQVRGKGADADKKAKELFGGIPDGGDFLQPLETHIKSKKYIRLASAEDLSPFYTLKMYSQRWGWSFNKKGSEAHNTAWSLKGGKREGHHYAIDLKITAASKDTPASGSAVLRKVSASICKGSYITNGGGRAEYPDFRVHDDVGILRAPIPQKEMETVGGDVDGPVTEKEDFTLFVGHTDDGVLFTCGSAVQPQWSDAYISQWGGGYEGMVLQVSGVEHSTVFMRAINPRSVGGGHQDTTEVDEHGRVTSFTTTYFAYDWAFPVGGGRTREYIADVFGVRDAYVHVIYSPESRHVSSPEGSLTITYSSQSGGIPVGVASGSEPLRTTETIPSEWGVYSYPEKIIEPYGFEGIVDYKRMQTGSNRFVFGTARELVAFWASRDTFSLEVWASSARTQRLIGGVNQIVNDVRSLTSGAILADEPDVSSTLIEDDEDITTPRYSFMGLLLPA